MSLEEEIRNKENTLLYLKMKKMLRDENLTCKWHDSSDLLPNKDGFFEVTNYIEDLRDLCVCEYDGYGFIYDGIYRQPKYWRKYNSLEKKYGRQIN